jgi:hypothetical protein
LREFTVTRKQVLLIVLIVVVASTISGLVAYRRALHSLPDSHLGNGPPGCVDFHDAATLAGEYGCVSARVLRVYTSRSGTMFLDFCEDYHNCPFTSVIFSSDKSKFGKLETLAGRRVEIRGTLTEYQGRPEIIIRDPEQLRVAH